MMSVEQKKAIFQRVSDLLARHPNESKMLSSWDSFLKISERDKGDVFLTKAIDNLLTLDRMNIDHLQPLVPLIMELTPEQQDLIFRNRAPWKKNEFTEAKYQPLRLKQVSETILNGGEFGYARLLYQLKVKAKMLIARGEGEAASAANLIHDTLAKAFKTFLISNKDKAACDSFIAESTTGTKLDGARAELAKHRGLGIKKLLMNLAFHLPLLVTTAGLGNVTAMVYKYHQSGGKTIFFQPKTDSDGRMDALDQKRDDLMPRKE